MKVILITLIIVCISYYVYSEGKHKSSGTHDDIVQCVFAISKESEITIKKRSNGCMYIFTRQYLQNIGHTDVIVKGLRRVTVKPGYNKTFFSPMTVHNVDNYRRAIVYASKCKESEEPTKDYDKNKLLKKTFNLGVKFINKEERKKNFNKLISYFWPDNKPNVWEQIYNVVKNFLDPTEQNETSTIINTHIKNIKADLVALNKMINNRNACIEKYSMIITYMDTLSEVFITEKDLTNLYISPLFSNFVTMQMYLHLIGYSNVHAPYGSAAIQNLYQFAKSYIVKLGRNSIPHIYENFYAGGLFNVMMNARSYYAVHVLEVYPIWTIINDKILRTPPKEKFYALSYSNLYGKATPNLLEQAIHIEGSALIGIKKKPVKKLNQILLYIIIENENQLETVYGLKLMFSSGLSYTMGTTEDAPNIKNEKLDLKENNILGLRVYKTKYIRCLQFILSKGEDRTIGNNCEDNSVNSIFKFEGHYIHSLYMANDCPETGKYFDNVAVSYVPDREYYYYF